MTLLSPHFTLEELTRNSRDLKNVPSAEQINALMRLCEKVLEPVRAHFGKPVIVTSGFRSPLVNKSVGGAATSQHLKGEAADIYVKSIPNVDVYSYIVSNLKFDQVIAERFSQRDKFRGWVHVSYTTAKPNRMQALSYVNGHYLTGLHYEK